MPLVFYDLQENIVNPFRSGKVKISVGKTSYEGLTQTFVMIDELSWLFRLKPSFVMLFPSEKALNTQGGTNVNIIYPKYADKNMEFNVLSSGTADLRTYFFGEPKEDRSFDMYYRFFEVGFKLFNFKGLDDSLLKLKSSTEISISSKDYEHPSFVSGKTEKFKVRARASRKN